MNAPTNRIDLLESKVREMIGLVQTLKSENAALKAQLAAQESRQAELASERELLDTERDQVRDRIQQMLDDLESVADAGSSAAEDPAPDGGAPDAMAADVMAVDDASMDALTEPEDPLDDISGDMPGNMSEDVDDAPETNAEEAAANEAHQEPVNTILPGFG